MQAGYKLAFELGYAYVIRVDGDGQHDASDIPRIFDALKTSGREMVIGSRFVDGNAGSSGACEVSASASFAWCCVPFWGKPVHDPTSGLVGVNRSALQVFSKSFPLEYPEIEALVVLQRKRFRFMEIPCKMRPRTTGRSSITALRVDLLHRARAARGLRERAEIRRAASGKGEKDVKGGTMDQLLNVVTVLSGLLFFLVLVSLRRATSAWNIR